jgi:hypothetical protein
MRRAIGALLAGIALAMAIASTAFAQEPPAVCGSMTGREYAQAHIVPMLQGGGVNNPGAHPPGSTHQGCAGFPF